MKFTLGIIIFVYNFAIVKHGYGEIGLAAFLVIGYLMLIILTIFLGMTEGLQPVFSCFNGTSQTARNKEMWHFSTKIILCTSFTCYLLVALLTRYFFSALIPEIEN